VDRTKIFVSYSHEDRHWLNRLAQHIAVLEGRGLVDLWSDVRIEGGEYWEREIDNALSKAKVAVLLVSPAFLASKFVWENEMPRIKAHADQGMVTMPLIIRPCAWRLEDFLAQLQARPRDGQALTLGTESQVGEHLSALTYELNTKVGKSPAVMSPSERSSKRVRTSPSPSEGSPDPTGEWTGLYNRTLEIRLVQERNAATFRGIMEYPRYGTVTIVEGTIHQSWSPDDEVWAQITSDTHGYAAIFKETGYEREGGNDISFNGEYRALVTENEMSGAWVTGKRLVGLFTLRRTELAG
jgi:hypothetical protein